MIVPRKENSTARDEGAERDRERIQSEQKTANSDMRRMLKSMRSASEFLKVPRPVEMDWLGDYVPRPAGA